MSEKEVHGFCPLNSYIEIEDVGPKDGGQRNIISPVWGFHDTKFSSPHPLTNWSNSYPTPDDIRKWCPLRGERITRASDPRERFLAPFSTWKLKSMWFSVKLKTPTLLAFLPQASQTDSRVCDASFAPSMACYYRQQVMKAVRMIRQYFTYICLMLSDWMDNNMCKLVALRIKKIHILWVWKCAWVCVLWACADARVGLCSHTWFFLSPYPSDILRQNHSLNPELINSASLGS